MRKVTVLSLLCLSLLQPASVLAARHPKGPSEAPPSRLFTIPSTKTVMLGSECDSGSKQTESISNPAEANASTHGMKLETKTPGKVILQGTWNVKVSLFDIEVYTTNKSQMEHIRQDLRSQFAEHSQTLLDLNADTFKSNVFKSSEQVSNKFWIVESTFNAFDSYDVSSDKHLWMGISPSYFDGLYTIVLTQKSVPGYTARVKYYLRGTRQ